MLKPTTANSLSSTIQTNTKMRTLKMTGLAGVGLLVMPSAALAHGGHPHEEGALHVLHSPEHLLISLLAGAALGAAMRIRHRRLILACKILLLILLLVQASTHAVAGGLQFAAEVTLSGASLAMGAWCGLRLIHRWTPEARLAARSESTQSGI